MVWKFLDTGSNTGRFNMDLDIQLANNLSENEVIFRVYSWNPYCISLGANQCNEEINIEKARLDNIDVVKRPTGGRAILHSEELTYSVIYPIDYKTSAHDLYNQINLALKKGLIFYNYTMNQLELENNQPDLKNFYKQDKSTICFAVSSKSEINFNSKKLVGSAQRKMGKVILQHGSILSGNYHLKIVDYLKIDNSVRQIIKGEIVNSTIDLKTILKKEIDYNRLKNSLKMGFESHFNIQFNLFNETVFT
ncbi:MAG: lipoate--protein ligase family protein [Ignavibacterium sp.]|nr:lipoate--protein ligase family protein [Ignavibacterium sp.]